MGKLTGSFEELHAARCLQTGNEDGDLPLEESLHRFGELFILLRAETNGDICKGCPVISADISNWDKAHRCSAFKRYHTDSPYYREKQQVAEPQPTETIAQIAKRLGISKSEVRRRKVSGEITQ